MLVLSRKRSEKLIITAPCGTRITVCMVDVRGDKGRIGIDAPKSWPVHREEVQRGLDSEADPELGKDFA